MKKQRKPILWIWWVAIAIFAIASATMFMMDRNRGVDYCGTYILTIPSELNEEYKEPLDDSYLDSGTSTVSTKQISFISVTVSETADSYKLDWSIESFIATSFQYDKYSETVAKDQLKNGVMTSEYLMSWLTDESSIMIMTDVKLIFYKNGLTVMRLFNMNDETTLYQMTSTLHLQKSEYEIISIFQLAGLISLAVATVLLIVTLVQLIRRHGNCAWHDLGLLLAGSLLTAATLIPQIMPYGLEGFYTNGKMAFRVTQGVHENDYYVERYDVHQIQPMDAYDVQEIESYTNSSNAVGPIYSYAAQAKDEKLYLTTDLVNLANRDVLTLTWDGIHYTEVTEKLSGGTYSVPLEYDLTRISDAYRIRRAAPFVIAGIAFIGVGTFITLLTMNLIVRRKQHLMARLQNSFRISELIYVNPNYEEVLEYMFSNTAHSLFDVDEDFYTMDQETTFPITYRRWDSLELRHFSQEIQVRKIKLKYGFDLVDEEGKTNHSILVAPKAIYMAVHLQTHILAMYELVKNTIHENPDEAIFAIPQNHTEEVSDDEWKK